MNLSSQLLSIVKRVNALELVEDKEEAIAELSPINDMMINFLNQISSLPREEFLFYNQEINRITPKIEQYVNLLIMQTGTVEQ